MSTAQAKRKVVSELWVVPRELAAEPRAVAAVDRSMVFTLGEITAESTDAIVSPAGAGLVDLAVRRAAGPELLEDFHRAAARLPQGRRRAGRAVITRGFRLRARHVVHCGPPVYADGQEQARADLAACHIEALRLAGEQHLRSIAFPAVGTGIHRFPVQEAAEVAVRTVLAELAAEATPTMVRFVLFAPSVLNAYVEAAVVALRALPVRDKGTSTFNLRRSQ